MSYKTCGGGRAAADGASIGRSELLSSFEAIADNSILFPSSDDRKRIDNWLTVCLGHADDRVRNGYVRSSTDQSALAAELAEFDFQRARSLQDVLEWTIERMEHGNVHVNHPRYFGLFNPTPTFPAQCADRVAAVFNPQLATATTSPFPVELEAHVIRSFARRAGLPPGSSGHFTTGGTEANFTAVICALTSANADFAMKGTRAFSGPPVIYVSRESHLAWLKIAHQAGIGRTAVRLVSTDGAGQMDPSALSECLSHDIETGHVPAMVAATAGTTGGGMIDPLGECSAIAREHGIWYHVDAAWGGAVVVSDKLRDLLRGIETADSVTIDGHKWLATTMGCGLFLTSKPTVLSEAFQVVMTCMPSNHAALDPYVTSVQWSRRFSGLRLFLALATAGWQGYARHVERAIALAELLSSQLVASGWKLVNKSSMAVVCVVPPSENFDPHAIARAVVMSGNAWISVANFEDRPVIRACVTSGESTVEDVTRLVASMNAAL